MQKSLILGYASIRLRSHTPMPDAQDTAALSVQQEPAFKTAENPVASTGARAISRGVKWRPSAGKPGLAGVHIP